MVKKGIWHDVDHWVKALESGKLSELTLMKQALIFTLAIQQYRAKKEGKIIPIKLFDLIDPKP